jgi:hypothetical protein
MIAGAIDNVQSPARRATLHGSVCPDAIYVSMLYMTASRHHRRETAGGGE